jgi:hypothetical protein
MSSSEPIQDPGDPHIPFNITSSPPPLPAQAMQTTEEVVMSDDTIIPIIRDNNSSMALNLNDIQFEYLASSPSPSCLRQQKRSQPHPIERPFPKVPRLSTIPAIPFSFNLTTTQSQDNNQDPTTQLVHQARDLLIKACSLCKSHDRQSRLLDLLEVFREYTEFGRIRHISTILASQVANLEKAIQRIESQAKAPQSKAPQAKAPIQSTQ